VTNSNLSPKIAVIITLYPTSLIFALAMIFPCDWPHEICSKKTRTCGLSDGTKKLSYH